MRSNSIPLYRVAVIATSRTSLQYTIWSSGVVVRYGVIRYGQKIATMVDMLLNAFPFFLFFSRIILNENDAFGSPNRAVSKQPGVSRQEIFLVAISSRNFGANSNVDFCLLRLSGCTYTSDKCAAYRKVAIVYKL